MKRWFGMFCALALAIFPAALAEEEIALESGVKLELDQAAQMDLDGDGAMETIVVRAQGVEDEEYIELYVTGSDGVTCSHRFELRRLIGAYVTDMDGDGAMEVLITGDEMSDDYRTWCLKYENDALVPIEFDSVERAEEEGNTDFSSGYGMIMSIQGNRIVLAGSQDVLGTWLSSREFALKDGRFALDDDGLWKIADIYEDADNWEYRALIPVKEIDVNFEDGTAGKLKIGEKFLPTAFDKQGVFYFVTQDGRRGSLKVEPNQTDGWGYLVGGTPDYDTFEFVPYAD